MTLLEVAGRGADRGRALGETCRDQIAAALDAWRAVTPGPAAVRSLVHDTALVRTAEAVTPDLLDEVLGLAEASNQPVDDVLAFQLSDESWWWWRSEGPPPGCTVLAMTKPDGSSVVGQNMDLPSHFEGSQLLVRHDDQLVLTAAGHLGFTGANAHGVVVLVNALLALPSSPAGLPVAFVIRHLLGASSLAEARRRLASVPHASGQSYLLASPEGIAAFECSAAGVIELPVGDRYCHTNHALAQPDETGAPNSFSRFDFCSAQLVSGDASRDRLWQLLSDRTVPVSFEVSTEIPASTFGSIVVETGAPPLVEVTLGPPSHTERLAVS